MAQLANVAVHQGFKVRRSERGAWLFSKGSQSVIEAATPSTAAQWARLIGGLRSVGLVFPTVERECSEKHQLFSLDGIK